LLKFYVRSRGAVKRLLTNNDGALSFEYVVVAAGVVAVVRRRPSPGQAAAHRPLSRARLRIPPGGGRAACFRQPTQSEPDVSSSHPKPGGEQPDSPAEQARDQTDVRGKRLRAAQYVAPAPNTCGDSRLPGGLDSTWPRSIPDPATASSPQHYQRSARASEGGPTGCRASAIWTASAQHWILNVLALAEIRCEMAMLF
jgi:hypothetical protein